MLTDYMQNKIVEKPIFFMNKDNLGGYRSSMKKNDPGRHNFFMSDLERLSKTKNITMNICDYNDKWTNSEFGNRRLRDELIGSKSLQAL